MFLHFIFLLGLTLFLAPAAEAFEPSGLAALGGRSRGANLRASGLYTSLKPASNGGRVGLNQGALAGRLPILRGERDDVALTARYNKWDFRPDSAAPSDLYDIQAGVTFTRRFSGDRSFSLSSTFGSASDEPFRDRTVNTIGATLAYTRPLSAVSRWSWILSYSNNRSSLSGVPLPGFAYTYAPSREFMTVLGLPFAMVNWKFAEKWSLQFFTLLPWTTKLQVEYRLTPRSQLFTGADFSQATFLRHGRTDKRERIFFDEKKLFLGWKFFPVELEAGYAYGRRTFLGRSYRKRSSAPVNLGAAPYGKFVVAWEFR